VSKEGRQSSPRGFSLNRAEASTLLLLGTLGVLFNVTVCISSLDVIHLLPEIAPRCPHTHIQYLPAVFTEPVLEPVFSCVLTTHCRGVECHASLCAKCIC